MLNDSRHNSLDTLRKKIQEILTAKPFDSTDDSRFWKIEKGTNSATIRFLPSYKDEPVPFVQMHTHGWEGLNKKWFIGNCPTSIQLECPCCKDNGRLWNLPGDEAAVVANRKISSARKRKLSYISNILVVKDPKHPENNGKVFLFRYGKKIFDMLAARICPQHEDMEPMDPFSLEGGANFRLRSTVKDGFPNYDSSLFDAPSAVTAEPLYPLQELLDSSHFKSFEELQRRFDLATGATSAELVSQPKPKATLPPDDFDTSPVLARPVKKPAAPAAQAATAEPDDFFDKEEARLQALAKIHD